MNNPLYEAARKLRLSGLISSLEIRLQEAMSHGLSHAEFLELVLQDELAVRDDRRLQRRVKSAMFRELKTLENFDWSFNPSIKRKQVFELATCRFIRETRDVLWMGLSMDVGIVTRLVNPNCYEAWRSADGVVSSRSTPDSWFLMDFSHPSAAPVGSS